jgi:hypothetical protein
MEWVQFVLFFIGVFGLFIWNRAEARQDSRHMDAQLKAQRELISEVHKESIEFTRQIQAEIKDFHGRLCTIEERNLRRD